ncbi:MAG: stage 0 sporulation family protein [Clostridia bacterium]
MATVIGVRFKKIGKIYYFSPRNMNIEVGQNVIVETARGVEFGDVALSNREVSDKKIVGELKQVIRIATEKDIAEYQINKQKEKDAFDVCTEKIKKHKIHMNLISTEYTFDRSKILFYFTADGRVDFRELVKDLASVFRTRIELRQIGVRDKSKMVGGLGICGKTLCCSTFLDDFQPVSINMAKDQGLSLNPVKISGTCGRLMCCLKYEQDVYAELNSYAPSNGSLVKTPDGRGVILENQILKRTVKVRLDGVDIPKYYDLNDIKVLKAGRVQHESKKIDPEVAKLMKE